MKKVVSLVGLCILSLLMVGEAVAVPVQGTKTPEINRRERRQRRRIRQGVRSGQLTKAEAARLRAEQRRIAAEKRRAKANGVVTRRERRKLVRAENRANRRIYRAKHNRRHRQ